MDFKTKCTSIFDRLKNYHYLVIVPRLKKTCDNVKVRSRSAMRKVRTYDYILVMNNKCSTDMQRLKRICSNEAIPYDCKIVTDKYCRVIKNAPKLKRVYAANKSVLERVEDCPRLKYIMLNNNVYMRELRDLPSLKEVHAEGKSVLESIENCPHVTRLYINNNMHYHHVKNMPNLKKVYAIGKSALKNLENCPNLKYLSINNNKTCTTLKNLPSLKRVDAMGKSGLKNIENCPNLKTINVKKARTPSMERL